MAENINIGGRLHSTATGNVVAGANEIYDDTKGKKQSVVNAETDTALENRYTKSETYNKTELNNMITTPSQEFETYTATDQDTDISDVLPSEGSADTVYRVGNWDGSQFDASKYSEYAWNGSQYVHLRTKTQIGEVFDISAYHATGGTLATYADLSAALDSNNGGGVPQSLQKGGMIVQFVHSVDNKYVQYRLMSDTFNTTVANWQGVDEVPTAESENLVKSGGVDESLKKYSYTLDAESDLEISDENGNVLVQFSQGNIKTKEFDSSEDATASKRGLMSANDKAKLNTIEQGAEVNDSETKNTNPADLDIGDNNYNVIVRFENGHIKTKNFDSSNIQPDKYPNPNLIGSQIMYNPVLDTTGLALFDSLDDIYDAYNALVTQYPDWFIRTTDLGLDESETYSMRHYVLRFQHPLITDDRQGDGTNLWDDTLYPYRRIIIQAGIHSNERYAILGCYLAIKEILESNEEWAMYIKQNFVVDVLPCSNPWGAENGWSNVNVNGKNLNRTYFTDIQAENQNIIDLIQELKPKGLIGIIDCHNTTNGDGYFVAKPEYTHWKYYALLTQHLQAALYDLTNSIFGTTRSNHFHLWDASGNNGQLHQYADSQGLLGCTFEMKTNAGYKGSIGTKVIAINLIQAFGSYVGN